MAATPSPDALPGLAVLEQTPIIIEKIVWAASDEQLHWKPAQDRWSISEVLAHLAEVEVVGFRERSLSALRYGPPGVLSRPGQHANIGPITVGQLMNEWAFHDLGHIRQIAELYRSRAFFPYIGPFQQFYTIKP